MKTSRIGILLLIASLAWPLLTVAQDESAEEQKRLDREHIQKDLEAARQELADASRRFAELSRQLASEAGSLAKEQVIALREMRMSRPIIGVVMAEGEDGDVTLAGVTPGGPADRAGLKSGDTLVSVNGTDIAGVDAAERLANARALIGELEEGDTVELGYAREGKRASVALEAEKMDRLMIWAPEAGSLEPLRRITEHFNLENLRLDEDGVAPEIDIERIVIDARDCEGENADCDRHRVFRAMRWSGLNLASVDTDLGRYFGVDRGALVLNPGRALDSLRAGDVILEIQGEPVDGPRAVMKALRTLTGGSTATLEIQRDQRVQTLELTVPETAALRFIEAPRAPSPPEPPKPPKAPRPPPGAPI